MPLPLRRALSAAVSSVRLRRALSTAAPHPPWAMIHHARLVRSPALRSSLLLADPPSASHLFVPSHLVNPRLHPDAGGETVGIHGGMVRATSGDGLLLLQFVDGTDVSKVREDEDEDGEYFRRYMDPDITRFVCNPVSGELFRLPDIDGTRKVPLPWHPNGILTHSARGHGPPDRYAVAELSLNHDAEEPSFVMRRFLSETGEWEKLVGLPSPLPLPLRMNMDHEVLAFGGRLWWVDLTWGAISADPFSDRPELRFVELPRDNVMPLPGTDQTAAQSMCRRIGVSEGRLRYFELSRKEHKEPSFLLSSFVLDDEGSGWTMESQLACRQVWGGEGGKDMPRIGVIDPLNASVAYLLIGNHSLAVDMENRKVLGRSLIHEVDEVEGPNSFVFSAFIKPCVLPPWLESSLIPSAGKKEVAGNNATADILVCASRD
ncbi:hypothetical protein ACP70R_035531 [Stipagrostis hirtigluma subsp. patula]